MQCVLRGSLLNWNGNVLPFIFKYNFIHFAATAGAQHLCQHFSKVFRSDSQLLIQIKQQKILFNR